jgi:hypothetical protein
MHRQNRRRETPKCGAHAIEKFKPRRTFLCSVSDRVCEKSARVSSLPDNRDGKNIKEKLGCCCCRDITPRVNSLAWRPLANGGTRRLQFPTIRRRQGTEGLSRKKFSLFYVFYRKWLQMKLFVFMLPSFLYPASMNFLCLEDVMMMTAA